MENGWYHVMNRGIDGRRLFPDHQANEHFRQLLARMPTRFDLRIHAYVLMGNHCHLGGNWKKWQRLGNGKTAGRSQ
jgi:putative transposase